MFCSRWRVKGGEVCLREECEAPVPAGTVHSFSCQRLSCFGSTNFATVASADSRCLGFFSSAVDKIPRLTQLKGEWFIPAWSSRAQAIVVLRSRQQELEAADCITYIHSREAEGMNPSCHSALSLCLCSPGSQPQ